MALLRMGEARLSLSGPLAVGGPAFLLIDGEITERAPFERALARKGRINLGTEMEVLIDAIDVTGPEILAEADGAFALAAWWPHRERLILARDRFGARPLYFSQVPGGLAFGSEIKALLAHPEVPRRLDLRGLDQVFTFWSTLAPRTIMEHVEEIPPGYYLEATPEGLSLRRYCNLLVAPRNLASNTEEAAGRLLREIEGSVKRRLRGNKAVGAYVSGGLDSTIIACLAEREVRDVLATFSVSFTHPVYDESLEQRRVARRLRSNHMSLSCTQADIAGVFPEVIRHVETPLVRTAPAPLFLLARLASQSGVRAVLTGEGADELFGGYDLFKEVKVRRFCAALPGSRLRPLLFKRLYHYMPALQALPADMLAAFYRARPEDLLDPLFSHRPRWSVTSGLKRLYHPDVRSELGRYDPIEDLREKLPSGFDCWDPFFRAQYLETLILLPALLAVQGDRVATANGIMLRTPFLDRRVVELATTLPVHMKMRGLKEKYLLRRATKSVVPDDLRQRVKQPYRAPESACFLSSEGEGDRQAWVEDVLSEERLRRDGVFEPSSVAALIRKIEQGAAPSARDDMAVVAVLSTGLVMEQLSTSSGGGCDA